MKILFATDGQPPARRAQKVLEKIGRRSGHAVRVMSVAGASEDVPVLEDRTRNRIAEAGQVSELATGDLRNEGFDADGFTRPGLTCGRDTQGDRRIPNRPDDPRCRPPHLAGQPHPRKRGHSRAPFVTHFGADRSRVVPGAGDRARPGGYRRFCPLATSDRAVRAFRRPGPLQRDRRGGSPQCPIHPRPAPGAGPDLRALRSTPARGTDRVGRRARDPRQGRCSRKPVSRRARRPTSARRPTFS